MGGTIYESIHYAIFSNFLLISAIKVQEPISTASKPSLDFLQCHRPSVTPTFVKILHKHTHMFIFQISCCHKAKRRAKLYQAAVSITPNLFPLNFFIPPSLFLNPTPKHFQFLILPTFQTMYQLDHVFFKLWYLCCASTIHNKIRNVAC